MATNIDVTLKRYNGTDYDVILPTSHLGQLYTDDTLSVSLSSYLDNRYINLDQVGANAGLATLNANGKLTNTQVPDYLFGGLKFAGATLSAVDVDTSGEVALLLDGVQQTYGNATIDGLVGLYWIASEDIVILNAGGPEQAGSTGRHYVWASQQPGEEDEDGTTGLTVESGDWVIVTAISGTGTSGDPYNVTFGIVNNTYQNASSNARGIVTLSSETNTTGTTDKVITEGILGGLIVPDNADLDGATNTNLIAPAAHHHDGQYYKESEVDAFFAGTASATGYNKVNWDLAYAEKINSAAFDTANGVLALTQQDTDIIAVDLDGRYAEDITAAQTDSADGIIVSQTGNTYTVAHFDTSSVADVTNTNGNVIQSMTFDTFGHLQTHATVDLDGRYYTETEIDDWIDGSGTINGNTYVPILYGAAPTSSITGALIIDID